MPILSTELGSCKATRQVHSMAAALQLCLPMRPHFGPTRRGPQPRKKLISTDSTRRKHAPPEMETKDAALVHVWFDT